MIERLEKTLEKLTRSGITEDFYLAGGTAVAIKHGHRRSEDFDFFAFPDRQQKKPEFREELRIFIASDIDIACMKAIAIAQRGSKKDFYDLWYLMRHHGWTMDDLEKALKRKAPSWSFGIFLRSLVYFEDAERESYPDIEDRWKEVKDFFMKLVKSYSKSRKRNRPTP